MCEGLYGDIDGDSIFGDSDGDSVSGDGDIVTGDRDSVSCDCRNLTAWAVRPAFHLRAGTRISPTTS